MRHRPIGVLGVLAELLAFARISCGMDFSVTHVGAFSESGSNEPDDTFVLMRGEIKPGDYNKLIRFSVDNNVNFLAYNFILASPGGDVAEALAIGRLLKSIYAQAIVGPRYGSCASACFIIFASAVDRVGVAGLVGIHRPYVAPGRLRSLTVTEAEREETKVLLDAEKYLHTLRVPRALIDQMFSRSSTDIHWLSDDELEQLGWRAPWYEELLVARCGLNTQKEKDALASEDPKAKEWLKHVADCASLLTAPDADRNLNAALVRYHAQKAGAR
jgi:ATP-dependent protease ClpP protease subunit